MLEIIDQSNVVIGGEMLPADDHRKADGCKSHSAHQGGELYGIYIHSQERDCGVSQNGAEQGTGNHAQEREDVASDGVEGNAGGGFFLREMVFWNPSPTILSS